MNSAQDPQEKQKKCSSLPARDPQCMFSTKNKKKKHKQTKTYTLPLSAVSKRVLNLGLSCNLTRLQTYSKHAEILNLITQCHCLPTWSYRPNSDKVENFYRKCLKEKPQVPIWKSTKKKVVNRVQLKQTTRLFLSPCAATNFLDFFYMISPTNTTSA